MTRSIEQLETRDCPSPLVAIVGVLRYDTGDGPGDVIPREYRNEPVLDVGETFYLEITVEDLRHYPRGVGGAGLDITWDAAVLECVSDWDTLHDPAGAIIASEWQLFRSGVLDNEAGRIDELGGMRIGSESATNRALGVTDPERAFLLHFRAEQPAWDALIKIELGRYGLGMTYRGHLWYTDVRRTDAVFRVAGWLPEDEPPIPTEDDIRQAFLDWRAWYDDITDRMPWVVRRGLIKPYYPHTELMAGWAVARIG